MCWSSAGGQGSWGRRREGTVIVGEGGEELGSQRTGGLSGHWEDTALTLTEMESHWWFKRSL